MGYKTILNNEEGSAIVMAILALAALTILGIGSINTTTTELGIARNERLYQENFYLAESAANQGLEALESATYDQLDDRNFTTFLWLKQDDSAVDMTDEVNWNLAVNSSNSSVGNADYAVVEKGVSKGGSLDMSATSNLYDYISRGYGYSENGRILIEIGYKKRH